MLSLSVGHVSRFGRISSLPQCFYCFFLTNAVALFQSLNQHSNPQLQMPEQKKRVGWAFRHVLRAGTMIETASPTFLSCITPHRTLHVHLHSLRILFAFHLQMHSAFVHCIRTISIFSRSSGYDRSVTGKFNVSGSRTVSERGGYHSVLYVEASSVAW